MIKQCFVCAQWFEGTAKKKYCSPRCKKNYENSLRSAPDKKGDGHRGRSTKQISPIIKPKTLSETASAIWDKIAPTVIARGHLNVLSSDAFAELCDLCARLADVNRMINERNRSLLQGELDGDKGDGNNGRGSESQSSRESSRESSLSDLKRKYSKQFLDYCKEFYLTPRVNRGNYGLENSEEKYHQDSLFD